jgi:hypothetical protein
MGGRGGSTVWAAEGSGVRGGHKPGPGGPFQNDGLLYSLGNPTSIVAPPRGGERDAWRAEYQHFPRGRPTSVRASSYGAALECLRSGISTWRLTPFTTSM